MIRPKITWRLKRWALGCAGAVLAGGILAPSCVAAEEAKQTRPVLHWLIWELSPEYIRSGPYKGQGFADKYLRYFIENLPEYEHKIIWTNVKRWPLLALRSGYCSPHIWGHFFKDKLAYSKAYTYTPPHVLIFHKRFRDHFGPTDTPLSIEALMKKGDLRLITMPLYTSSDGQQPRYPVLIDYLTPYRGQPNLIEQQHGTNEVDLRFLEKGRADMAIGYPTTIIAQQRDRGMKASDFVYYPIKEHTAYKTIHVSCLDDAFGREVIAKVNKTLSKETMETFLGYYNEWSGGSPRFNREVKVNLTDPEKIN